MSLWTWQLSDNDSHHGLHTLSKHNSAVSLPVGKFRGKYPRSLPSLRCTCVGYASISTDMILFWFHLSYRMMSCNLLFDLYEDLNRVMTSVSDSATQIVFFSKFTKRVLSETKPTNFLPKKKACAPVHIIIAVCVAVFVLFSLLGVISLVVVLHIRWVSCAHVLCTWKWVNLHIPFPWQWCCEYYYYSIFARHKHCNKGEGRRCCRPYDPVAGWVCVCYSLWICFALCIFLWYPCVAIMTTVHCHTEALTLALIMSVPPLFVFN